MDQGTHQLLEVAGFAFFKEVGSDSFRGCPLVSSGMDFKSPALLGDVIELSSEVESFGTKSFRTVHHFNRENTLLASGFEVRVWTAASKDAPSGMTGVPVPDEVREMLSRDGVHDATL